MTKVPSFTDASIQKTHPYARPHVTAPHSDDIHLPHSPSPSSFLLPKRFFPATRHDAEHTDQTRSVPAQYGGTRNIMDSMMACSPSHLSPVCTKEGTTNHWKPTLKHAPMKKLAAIARTCTIPGITAQKIVTSQFITGKHAPMERGRNDRTSVTELCCSARAGVDKTPIWLAIDRATIRSQCIYHEHHGCKQGRATSTKNPSKNTSAETRQCPPSPCRTPHQLQVDHSKTYQEPTQPSRNVSQVNRPLVSRRCLLL